MPIKVLVVDDSSFFRRRVSDIINADPELEVIDTASNGQEAIDKIARLRPNVVTMDIEMPVMDGITAVRRIMASEPLPILMFSSLTHEGARATLDALDAGAADFLPKKFEDIARNRDEATLLLQQRVKALGQRRGNISRATMPPMHRATPTMPSHGRTAPRPVARPQPSAPVSSPTPTTSPRVRRSGKQYKILAIGTSTGGPVALQNVLTKFPANYPHPILLVQHMPAAFTGAFAQRLNSLCKISLKEAANGDVLRPGCAYLAPGGKQMLVEGTSNNARLKIVDGGDKVNYKPCVDITFASLAKVYQGNALAVVLTGMGADGRDGARLLKSYGSKIWAQDEDSCVVYGMPQAVVNSGLAESVIPLENMAERILVETTNGAA